MVLTDLKSQLSCVLKKLFFSITSVQMFSCGIAHSSDCQLTWELVSVFGIPLKVLAGV